jgi:hypothetical protein
MKAMLLIAVMLEGEKTRRPLSNRKLLERIKKRGGFSRWEVKSLEVELSKARRWAKTKEGQNWIDNEARAMEEFMAAADAKEKATDLVDHS